MADTTKGDSTVLYLGLLPPALMFLVAGLVIQSFIIGVNVTDWWKGRSVTPVDHIVTSLGIFRLCAQCVVTLYVFVATLIPGNLLSYIALLIMAEGYYFFAYNNMLLTFFLSIIFCLKISNLHTGLFLCLRRFMVHRTLYFRVASILLPVFTSLISLAITGVPEDEEYNTTMDDLVMNYTTHIDSKCSNTMEIFFPLIFYSISSVLLFTSLYHHTTRMKMSSNLSINLETYYSVMRFVSVTFIYNIMYLVVNFAHVIYFYFYCIYLSWLFIILGFLPVLHSSYLICRKAKLRDQMSKVLHNVNYFLLQRKITETQENIEVQM